jgi:hypothetical protein
MYRKEFEVALKEAEKINEEIFKGELAGRGGLLVQETKQTLHFRFVFHKGTEAGRPVKTQSEIVEEKGIKLFTGFINSSYRKVGENDMVVDVFVVNTQTYDEVSRDREEILRRLRGR